MGRRDPIGNERDESRVFSIPRSLLRVVASGCVLSCLAAAAGVVRAQSRGMVVDDATRQAIVFDTGTDAVVGSVLFGTGGGAAGDCALFTEDVPGFLTDFGSRLWAIDLATTPPQLAPAPNPVPIANPGEDLAFTADGRYLVACDGSGLYPVSVIDVALRTQVATFSLGSDCNAVDVCDDGSVLVSSSNTDRIRRLVIQPDGQLQDTGESLSVPEPNNVNCSPGSGSGVVIEGSPATVRSFAIPGLTPVSMRSFSAPGNGLSMVINAEGDRLFARSQDMVEAYAFDSATGILGPGPLLTLPLPLASPDFFGMDQMALDPEGGKLYVSQPEEVRVYDAATGALLGTITHPQLVAGNGICISRLPDADGDGLDDAAEQAAGTDPDNPDTDGDGLLDGFEVEHGFDPLTPGGATDDPDGDGLDNLAEQSARTDPADPDTDGDGLTDGEEVLVTGSNPRRADTDADGVGDALDVCPVTHDPGQEDILHPGGAGDACEDHDGDGVFDRVDTCPDLANPDQADQDGDGHGDLCDPFPALYMRIRTLVMVAAPAGPQPVPVHYRLEDADGNLHTGLSGMRATLTLTGSALFGAGATAGILIDGGGTNRALVEFVGGLVSLTITDPVPEQVTLSVEDSVPIGAVVVPTDIRFRGDAVDVGPLGMVVDNATRRAVVLDLTDDTVVASVPFPPDGPGAGDCVLSSDVGVGFVTDFGGRLWAIDATTDAPALASPPNPIPIANPGEDLAFSASGRYVVACDGAGGSNPVSVVDTLHQVEVSSFDVGSDCNAVDVCDDGSVLVSSWDTGRIRRLTLDADGVLHDTGDSLSVSGPMNVYCAPGSRSGVAVQASPRRLQPFLIPGLVPMPFRLLTATSTGISAVFNRSGDRIYARGNNAVDLFAFDPATGRLVGSVLSIPLPAGATTFFGMDQMTLHRDGSRLYVPQPNGVRVHDATTGALLKTITDPAIVAPTGICVASFLDTDQDGLGDLAEAAAGTDPLNPDSDDDGLRDGFEVEHGFDPLAPGEEAQDPDGDGLDNLLEQEIGTDPGDPDTDADGLEDGHEVLVTGTSPRSADTDLDGDPDGADNCPLTSNPGQEDVVHPNGIGDACDDPDADGHFDTADNCPDVANPGQENGDGDLPGDACDLFPTQVLRVRPLTLLAGPTSGPPVPVRFRLEDQQGALLDTLVGIRATVTASGSALFGNVPHEGEILAGGGTNQALVEFVDGYAVLPLADAVPEVVTLSGTDTQRIGLTVLSTRLRFRTGSGQADALGMVVDNGSFSAVVFDTSSDTVIGNVPLAPGGLVGDCALPAELGDGFVAAAGFNLRVVDVTVTPPQSSTASNPIPIVNSGRDASLSADSRFILTCGANSSGSSFGVVSVVDTIRRLQVGTFFLQSDCTSVDVCDDGSVLVSSPGASRVRRLSLSATGSLTDTGEFLTVSTPFNVACAAGSRAGVVVNGNARTLQSFAIPGLAPVSSRLIGGATLVDSVIANRSGNRVYTRSNSTIDMFALDPATGALGATPQFTVPLPSPFLGFTGLDPIALDRSGGKLYVSASGSVRVHDATTGQFLRALTGTGISAPTGVCTASMADADDDGLSDNAEAVYGTDPVDPDSDGDGLADGFEVDHGFDPRAAGEESQDPDGDGLENLGEQSEGTDPNDADTDDDGLSDGDELLLGTSPLLGDSDTDSVGDAHDNCPLQPNPGQQDLIHPGGAGDACDDPDGDGRADAQDNCPDATNAAQTDADADGRGDVCDPCPIDPLNDLDGDGFCANFDVCPELANPDQEDMDADQVGDLCDLCPAIANPLQEESFGCVALTENGGQCLETTIDLVPGIASGRLIIPGTAIDLLFSGGVLPPLVEIGTLPDGGHELCLSGPAGLTASQLLGSTSSGQLLAINATTGAGTLVANLPSAAADIAYDAESGRAFLVTSRELREFDIDTGAAIGPVRGTSVFVASLEFVDGTLYGSTSAIPNGSGDLRRINPDTGATTFIGSIGTPVLTGLAWDGAGGVLFGVTGGSALSSLVTVNPATGATAPVGSTNRQLGSLHFGPDGLLYAGGVGGNTGRIFRINRTTGAATLVGLSGFGDITGLTDVPGSGDCRAFTKNGEEALAINGAACGAPTAVAQAAPTIECTSPLGAAVALDGSGSTDPNSTPGTQDDIVSYEWLEDPGTAAEVLLGTGPFLNMTLSLGQHSLGLRVTDSYGETDLDAFEVTVVDTVRPALSLGLDPQVLWPPNHRLILVDTSPAASDLCGDPAVTLASITSSEPDNADGPSDGNTVNDIQNATGGTLDVAFELRAERDEVGEGRFYFVVYRAVDAAGNESFAERLVTVPLNRDGTTEPLNLSVHEGAGGTVVSWGGVTGALYYNVIRGRVRDIVDGESAIDLGGVTCLAAHETGLDTAADADTASPSSGDIFFYLVEYHDGWRASSFGTVGTHSPRLPGAGSCP